MTFLTSSIQETLERKIEFCEHLLSMAAKLCPGASEMHGLYTTNYLLHYNIAVTGTLSYLTASAGYLLFESIGARQRLAQWKWIRMRITTAQYIDELKKLEEGARTVVDVFGQIRNGVGSKN